MPIRTFVAGETLTAANVNAYLMQQSVITCTSGTRPASPVQGMVIYETDTDKVWAYNGTTWALPKNVAGGLVPNGYAGITSIQTGITTEADLTGGSITVTLAAGRRYRLHGYARLQSSVDGDYGSLVIADGSNTHLAEAQIKLGTSTQDLRAAKIWVPGAGTYTFKLRASRSVGTGTLQTNHASTNEGFIAIEDAGT
ncbi:MAG TPA: hypothetical protein VFJ85_02810 [Acidimicrobiales bacterium]|nr:hypothetical protein [Acidimicrobiales bacterium]